MDVIRLSIGKPVAVLVGIILVVLFGYLGLQRMPYQLSPSVVEPEISVSTTWRGAAPYEIEREIIERQEDALKGVTGLVQMESDSQDGMGTITLRFKLGTDVDDALLRVSNKINEVSGYPLNAEKPVISATGSATSPVIWVVMQTLEGNSRPIETYRTFFEDEVRQHLERVEGVADLFVGGGREDEMQVIVRPEDLASHGLTVNDLIRVLRGENVNISAGDLDVGRRNYRIRTTGEFKSPLDIESTVISSTGERRLLVRDIAGVERGHQERDAVVMHNGNPSIAIGIRPEPDANILEMTSRVEEAVKQINRDLMEPQGIRFHWVYDQRFYINGAISLIRQNILIGGFLAVTVLLIFLRSIRSTLVVGMSIPISIIGSFIVMNALNRNLNVVSLAGIAFAVGMLVDSAIVVMENIDRHRTMGKEPSDAAYKGTREVWGAILASTLTTVAVFLPVVFMEEEAGQLFRDIAIAVVTAVSLSLFVSVSVIPMLSSRVLASGRKRELAFMRSVARLGSGISDGMMSLLGRAVHNTSSRLVTVGGLIALAVVAVVLLIPKTEYLPQGNRNFVLTILVPPPGLSDAEVDGIGQELFRQAEPYMGEDYKGVPGIKDMFFVGRGPFMIAGAMSIHWDRASELLPLFNRMVFSIPAMVGISQQAGIFQTRIGGGRTIELNISGNNMDSIASAAGMIYGRLQPTMPRIRPVPSIELLYPEVRIIPDRDRLRANGMTSEDLGVALDVLLDGRIIGDYREEGKKKIDFVVKATEQRIGTPEQLYTSQVATPDGKIVPVSSLSALERTVGITQIRHLERNRTITLQITPPEEMPLESAMESIEQDILPSVSEAGVLEGLKINMSGAADKLTQARKALQWNFLLAAVIAYLLMSALFGNFLYPLVIMFTVPLAGAGGVLGLRILNLFVHQPMDILTMLGFVILVGVVVNNAILIVHQALNNIRYEGMEHYEAVMESVRTRIRPIYMSASTSIFGMLPLVLFPGAGSELYRGLGSVILGGLALSTVFTVFVIPSLLMFIIKVEKPGDENTEQEAAR